MFCRVSFASRKHLFNPHRYSAIFRKVSGMQPIMLEPEQVPYLITKICIFGMPFPNLPEYIIDPSYVILPFGSTVLSIRRLIRIVRSFSTFPLVEFLLSRRFYHTLHKKKALLPLSIRHMRRESSSGRR